MKVQAPAYPTEVVQHQAFPARQPRGNPLAPQPTTPPPPESFRDFRAIYDAWFDDVSRWIRALGGPDADRDDIVQEVFLVVRRRLSAFDGANLPAWLYRITRRQVRDYRRRAWVKHIFSKRRIAEPDALPHSE